MQGVDTTSPAGSKSLPFTLAAAGLGTQKLPCVQAVAVCGTGRRSSRLLALNRCAEPSPVSLSEVCTGRSQAWSAVKVFDANVSAAGAGRVWTMLGDSDGPMVPRMKGGGSGAVVAADAFALSVIELS